MRLLSGRRMHSLRARLALWMFVSTAVTLAAFATIAYGLVVAESSETAADRRSENEAPEDSREEVLVAMLVAAPVCIAISVGGALILSRRALGPLDAVIRETSAMKSGDLHRRLEVPPRNDELRDLVVGLNGLLARLDDGFSALGRYAESASHELRTPLAVMMNDLEVALRRPRTAEEWERTASATLDELRRLTTLVQALLWLSDERVDPMLLSPVDVGSLVEHSILASAKDAKRRHVEVVAVGASSAVVTGNAELLESALDELVRNALRYGPAGRVFLRVETPSDRSVAIHVDDAGAGVAADERDAIFAPFKRGRARLAEGRESDEHGGFGLGLAVAKRSVERCGGELTGGTSPEGGARFTMLLAKRAPHG